MDNNNKRKLLFVLPYYPATRFTCLYDYILGLSLSNFDVELLAIRKEKNEIEHSYFRNKCKISYLDESFLKLNLLQLLISSIISLILFFDIMRFLINYKFLKSIITLIARYRRRYDYIYATYSILTCVYAVFFKKISKNTKIGFGIFDYYAGIFNLRIPEKHIDYKVWINKKLIRFALTKVDFFTAFRSDFYNKIEDLFRKLNIDRKFRFNVIEPTLSFCPINYNKMREKDKSFYKIISITGFERFKGTLDFLSSFTDFIKNTNNFHFTFIGVGIINKRVEEFIKNKNLHDKLKIISIEDRTNLIELMCSSDIIIHTSYIETGPVVLVESLVCGKPIFIQNVGIAKRVSLISDGVYIYDNFDDLKNKLINFINQKQIFNIKISLVFKNNEHFNIIINKLARIFS